MEQNWIIDVLADLRSFARKNDMPLLTAQLEEAATVASGEIAFKAEAAARLTRGDSTETRQISAGAGSGRHD